MANNALIYGIDHSSGLITACPDLIGLEPTFGPLIELRSAHSHAAYIKLVLVLIQTPVTRRSIRQSTEHSHADRVQKPFPDPRFNPLIIMPWLSQVE